MPGFQACAFRCLNPVLNVGSGPVHHEATPATRTHDSTISPKPVAKLYAETMARPSVSPESYFRLCESRPS